MTGIEELLREELHARASAADAAGTDPAAALEAGVRRRLSAWRTRRRIMATTSSALAMAAVVALALSLWPGGSGQGPAGPAGGPSPDGKAPFADTSLTPPGWSPVSYRDAQVSVPSSWLVENGRYRPCGFSRPPGIVYLGASAAGQSPVRTTCPRAGGVVSMAPLSVSARAAWRANAEINGLPAARHVSPAGALRYQVPALGLVLAVRGPLAGRIVATLTRSPLSVVLAPGPAPAVPVSWRWFRFGGIAFAAPAGWAVRRTGLLAGCPYEELTADTVQLRNVPILPGVPIGLECNYVPPTAGVRAGKPGIAVGTGLKVRVSHGRCFSLQGMRACQVSYQYASSLLDLVVYPPGRARPDTVLIGLAGTGATARTILDSIRPAAGPH